jgi:hypothetical protein
LDNGNIYIGVANLDPITNPLQVYYDEALTIAASQPLKTSNGYIYRNGTPAQLYVNAADFSITVNDSKNLLVYNFPDGTGLGADATSVVYNEGDIGAVNRTVAGRLQDYVSVKDFGAVGNDLANDTAAFVAAAATGKAIIIPQGTYRVAGVLFTTRVTFAGNAKIRRTGGSLAFAGGIEAPCAQIFLDAVGTAQVDVNNDLTPEGWVDWFGTDANAIETCHKIFKINRFGPHDYVVTRTVILDQSYRQVLGSGGSAEGPGGTRIILTGAAAATDPVVRVGTLNTASVAACSRRLNISWINTVRDGVVNPSSTNRRENAVPGWLVAGWYESQMSHIFDYGSPIGYRVYGTVFCTMDHTGCVRPTAGASNGFTDFFTAHCIGGFSTSFGFIGANASLSLSNSSCAGAVGTSRLGVYLFGYIGDTWIDKYEMSQLDLGIYVDGRDAAGVKITSLSAHQDVRVNDCVLDAVLSNCLTVTHLNEGAGIQLRGNYCAQNAPGAAILVDETDGLVLFDGGDTIANPNLDNIGIRISNSKTVQVNGTMFKDFRVGVYAENSDQLRLTPAMRRGSTSGTYGVYLDNVTRSYVAPIVDGAILSWTHGIYTTSTMDYVETNLSAINWGCFVTPAASYKLWYNGATVTTDTYGTTNLRSGVVG